MVALRLKVVLHEGLLTAAVPEVEHQVSKEADVGVLNVDRRSEPHRVACEIVGKDDRAHRRLAGARLAHQQHLLQHTERSSLARAYNQPHTEQRAQRASLGRYSAPFLRDSTLYKEQKKKEQH